jgi:hypothetical protein
MKLTLTVLSAALLMTASASSFATDHYCIATAGGYGHDGTTFVGIGFDVPSEGKCVPWAGITKTAGTVILVTSGTGCLSSDGKALTLSLSSGDPDWLGANRLGADYIKLLRSENKGSFTSGTDKGEFGGSADVITCTSSLESLPSSHD